MHDEQIIYLVFHFFFVKRKRKGYSSMKNILFIYLFDNHECSGQFTFILTNLTAHEVNDGLMRGFEMMIIGLN